jgi:VRR-NUC domain
MSKPKTVEASRYLATETEAQFQRTVIEAAMLLGWLVFHFPRMIGNPTGFPDLILIRDGVTIYRELKTPRGRVSAHQHLMHERLRDAGADVAVWYSTDWDAIEATLTRQPSSGSGSPIGSGMAV